MKFTPARLAELEGSFQILKHPGLDRPAAQRDPKVIATVSEMLSTIEKGGLDAVLSYARALDGFESTQVELGAAELARSGDSLSPELRTALELGHERTSAFARETRSHLVDFETQLAPGLTTGVRYVP
ncbi:MAG: histidinol dehydrogenase, partial [Nocardia sp.]|nr:histidinol dehydrogenase [Nocardia sp.]